MYYTHLLNREILSCENKMSMVQMHQTAPQGWPRLLVPLDYLKVTFIESFCV